MAVFVFVDSSAQLPLLNDSDPLHIEATAHWHRLLDGIKAGEIAAITHSGVVSEAVSLVQRRLGMASVRQLNDRILRLLHIVWVDEELHDRAFAAMLAADRRRVSLVDWTSFELMRSRGIAHALAFDTHFEERGFTLPWG
ncbi:MAG: PIN domain-containing protein [bacterium]|nr:PIN domain-containing protein [bacterium]